MEAARMMRQQVVIGDRHIVRERSLSWQWQN